MPLFAASETAQAAPKVEFNTGPPPAPPTAAPGAAPPAAPKP
jgi:hypothetical protein